MIFFQTLARGLSRLAAALSAVILLYIVGHILVEIVLRSFFANSTFVLDEFVGYAIAAMTFLSLGYALEEGALIRVNVLLSRLQGRTRQAAEVLAVASTLVLTVFVGFYVWKGVARNWQRGAVSESIAEVPLWIPESLVFAGLALFGLQLFAYLLRLLAGGPPIAGDRPLD